MPAAPRVGGNSARGSFATPGDGDATSNAWGTIIVQGELDAATVGVFRSRLSTAVASNRCGLIVDLTGVTFMDASTLGALIVAESDLRTTERRLVVRGAPLCVRRLFDLCDVGSRFDTLPE